MVTKAFIFGILPTICFFLTAVSSRSGGHGVLSELYQRAVNEHRPLVLVLDSENGPLHESLGVPRPHKSKHVAQKKTKDLSSVTEEQVGENELSLIKVIIRKILALVQNSDSFLHGSKQKKITKPGLRTKEQLVVPLLKSLLRVSNDMNCRAKDNCEETGGPKVECEKKFQCEKEKPKQEEDEDACGVGEEDECDEDLPSTKGYILESEDNTCTRC